MWNEGIYHGGGRLHACGRWRSIKGGIEGLETTKVRESKLARKSDTCTHPAAIKGPVKGPWATADISRKLRHPVTATSCESLWSLLAGLWSFHGSHPERGGVRAETLIHFFNSSQKAFVFCYSESARTWDVVSTVLFLPLKYPTALYFCP